MIGFAHINYRFKDDYILNKEMLNKLGTYVDSDELISVYTNVDESDIFTLGYLIGIDENNVLMNMVDRYGEEIGFCIINANDIYNIEHDKMYSGKIEKLFKLKEQKRQYISNSDSNPMVNFLKHAFDNHLLIQVNEDDYYIGYVKDFSDQILTTEKIDNYGDEIGISSLDMNNVNSLKCQTKYLRDIELIRNSK